MKTIFKDDFTGSIAVGCSESECIIDYFDTVEKAEEQYPKAILDPSIGKERALTISTNYDKDVVTIEINNQVLRLSLFQAQQLKSIL